MTRLALRALPAGLVLKLSAMACITAFALTPALAKPNCSDSTTATGNSHYAGACVGPLQGNITAGSSVTIDGGTFDLFGSSQGDDGLVEAPHGETTGTLQLAQTLYHRFVIALKSGNSYSLYLFDAGDAGLEEIAFDTQGVSVGTGDKLSHAFVFAPPGTLRQSDAETAAGETQGPAAQVPAQAVPEPASGALALLALAAAGLAARRSRR